MDESRYLRQFSISLIEGRWTGISSGGIAPNNISLSPGKTIAYTTHLLFLNFTFWIKYLVRKGTIAVLL